MKQWSTIEDVLEFAINSEEESVQFYTRLAERVEKPGMRAVFEGFAREEKGHKAKLTSIKEGHRDLSIADKVQDLKIGDYLVEQKPDPELDYQQALILAMKKEKAAFRLYTDLAGLAESENLRQTFQALAQEEAKHKLRFEMEYDDNILKHN
ncbi:MAG: rubrerythrin [Chloroflexi bacterium RBG_13_60_13]|nr:MAG: rubrerythrin [Chloroflexi bacterium RBG_13_60_13]